MKRKRKRKAIVGRQPEKSFFEILLRVSHMLMAISVLGEPKRVNLVVQALKLDYLLLDIFLHLQSETWTQWTIKAAQVKVHHRPYSFEDGAVVYPANAFDSCLRGD